MHLASSSTSVGRMAKKFVANKTRKREIQSHMNVSLLRSSKNVHNLVNSNFRFVPGNKSPPHLEEEALLFGHTGPVSAQRCSAENQSKEGNSILQSGCPVARLETRTQRRFLKHMSFTGRLFHPSSRTTMPHIRTNPHKDATKLYFNVTPFSQKTCVNVHGIGQASSFVVKSQQEQIYVASVFSSPQMTWSWSTVSLGKQEPSWKSWHSFFVDKKRYKTLCAEATAQDKRYIV